MRFESPNNAVVESQAEKDPKAEAIARITASFDSRVSGASSVDEILSAYDRAQGAWEVLDQKGPPEYSDSEGFSATLDDYQKGLARQYAEAVTSGNNERTQQFGDSGIPTIVKQKIRALLQSS